VLVRVLYWRQSLVDHSCATTCSALALLRLAACASPPGVLAVMAPFPPPPTSLLLFLLPPSSSSPARVRPRSLQELQQMLHQQARSNRADEFK